jgi:hypothetical protein
MQLKSILLAALLTVATRSYGQTGVPVSVQVFDSANIADVYRISLDRDALLLESITNVIKAKKIADGQVIISSGSVQECTYHYVTSTAVKANNEYKTVKGPAEILSGGGIIADGQPHIHIALSNPERGAYGGHLEKGCRVLYLAEVTIFRYAGPALTRKVNANGISILQPK